MEITAADNPKPKCDGELIITVGFPLSGKSTLSKRVVNHCDKVVIVCPDTIRLALHGQQFIGLAEPFVWAMAQTMVRTLLIQGFTIIVDATNTTKERRSMWRQIAKDFNLTLNIYWVDTPASVCHDRNELIERLNPAVIDRMANQFEPPEAREGDIYTCKDVERVLNNTSSLPVSIRKIARNGRVAQE